MIITSFHEFQVSLSLFLYFLVYQKLNSLKKSGDIKRKIQKNLWIVKNLWIIKNLWIVRPNRLYDKSGIIDTKLDTFGSTVLYLIL